MFLTDLILRSIKGTRSSWEVSEDFVYETWNEVIISVPKGFKTDLASVPLLFQGVFPKAGRYREAAVIHDYLYSGKGFGIYNRKQADQIFYQAMTDLKIAWWRKSLIYRAVRLGGGLYWNKNKLGENNA